MKRALAVTSIGIMLLVIIIPVLIVLVTKDQTPVKQKMTSNEQVTIKVYLPEKNKTISLGLEAYVRGVVAAEMPAEFDVEALKAQAVAARTYAVKNMKVYGGNGFAGYPDADVSSDHRQGQAWTDEANLMERWGKDGFARYWQKIGQAVELTRGQILNYKGEVINAVFHSTSGDATASAKEVWGFDYPYLVSVPCPWDKKSPRYSDSREMPLAEIDQRLGTDTGIAAVAQNGAVVVQILDYTASGRVDKARFGAKILSGADIREKLGLRSTNFSVEMKHGKILFKTIGYGHGVGLCQYGANGMAKEGRTYRQILAYYYTGTELKNLYDN